MIIDIHTHITNDDFPEFSRAMLGRGPFTADILLKRMDMEGIDRSVLLPLPSPECLDYYGVAGNQDCIRAARKHPDRLSAFCYVDPRSITNYTDDGIAKLLRIYKDLGCLGIGEMTASLEMDDILYQRLFFNAGEEKMPIIFHFKPQGSTSYGAIDDLGLPRTEKMLAMFSKTIFLGHSQCFWNELLGSLTEKTRCNYFKEPYETKGRLWTLFEKYPNLYGDCSAGSAFYALSCDPKGYEFLERFHKQICFGTDRFTGLDEPIPGIITYLKDGLAEGKISAQSYEAIMHKNFERIIS